MNSDKFSTNTPFSLFYLIYKFYLSGLNKSVMVSLYIYKYDTLTIIFSLSIFYYSIILNICYTDLGINPS